jgi:hypothetical protein
VNHASVSPFRSAASSGFEPFAQWPERSRDLKTTRWRNRSSSACRR